MEEIKIDDYIRTITGFIARVINVNDFREPSMKYGIVANYFDDIRFIGDEIIAKHSPRIIDLIEEGDFVNEEEVDKVKEDKNGKRIVTAELRVYREDNIESVVTHENYERAKYAVEGFVDYGDDEEEE